MGHSLFKIRLTERTHTRSTRCPPRYCDRELLPTRQPQKEALRTMAEPEGDDEQRYFSDPAVVRKIIPPFALLRLNTDVRGKLLGFLVCASQDRALRTFACACMHVSLLVNVRICMGAHVCLAFFVLLRLPLCVCHV